MSKETKPEFILWSQNLYDTSFEKLIGMKNQNLEDTCEEITKVIQEKLGSDDVKSHSIIYTHHIGKSESNGALWNMLANEDDKIVNSILFDNFIYGTSVSLPIDKEKDRYLLILVRRN